ncbi:TlpA disulfide reductase family protein [Pedobacter sp. KR3-3]|uniref:TlpA disulfide reductase family protein n=1 Tax=Pedobacter albus TaxID=3113905 RepID=A0ABU7ICQ9_9SPHI|nr:TlpA disulfide reductase family protein [Pedobacter sp. KR3-3]MEE1947265.1 TlpA disulfide reductase family protein [Pedobacter sp. KR3-3]
MKFLLNLLLCTLLLACRPSTPKIVLHIPNADYFPLKAILWKLRFTDSGWQKIRFDSTIITQQSFDWQLKHQRPFVANLTLYNAKGNIIAFTGDFIYSDAVLSAKPLANERPINIKGYENARTMAVEGGENQLFSNQDFMAKPNFMLPDSLVVIFDKGTDIPPNAAALFEKWKAYRDKIYQNTITHKNAYYTLYRLVDLTHTLRYPTIEKCYNALDPSLKNTPEGNYLLDFISNSKKMVQAGILPDLDVLDKNKKSTPFKTLLTKKYYLLDFWASWCKPCRAQFPALRSIYNTVDTNKLQFISISIDENDGNWHQALAEEKLEWPNYLQKESSVKKQLLIAYIPQNILLDENGKIVDRNIKLQNLKGFLASKGFLKN